MNAEKKLTAREEFFSTPRGEREVFEDLFDVNIDEDAQVVLPITYDGFEALMELVSSRYNLPLDDAGRSVIAGFVHHLDNDVVSVPLAKLGKVLAKSIANNMTWHVDQKLKMAAKKLLEDEEAKRKASEPAPPADSSSPVEPAIN